MRQGFRRDSVERVGVVYKINGTKVARGIFLLAFAAGLRAQSHWPAQLETDIKAGSWGAAPRGGRTCRASFHSFTSSIRKEESASTLPGSKMTGSSRASWIG